MTQYLQLSTYFYNYRHFYEYFLLDIWQRQITKEYDGYWVYITLIWITSVDWIDLSMLIYTLYRYATVPKCFATLPFFTIFVRTVRYLISKHYVIMLMEDGSFGQFSAKMLYWHIIIKIRSSYVQMQFLRDQYIKHVDCGHNRKIGYK